MTTLQAKLAIELNKQGYGVFYIADKLGVDFHNIISVVHAAMIREVK